MQVATFAERPDLAARTGEVEDSFAEFVHHSDVPGRYWPKLGEELPELQLVLYDDECDVVVGRGNTIPASTLPVVDADHWHGRRMGGVDRPRRFPGRRRVRRARRPRARWRFEGAGTGRYVEPNVWMRHVV